MHMRLLLLGGGSALGQSLIRQGAEEGISFLAPRPPESGWDASSLTQLMDETRPDVVINLAYYFDWFQSDSVDDERFVFQQRAVERLAGLCTHHDAILLQPTSYRVFDGARATAYSEKDDPEPWGRRGQALLKIEQSVRAMCSRHVLLRFGWLLDDSSGGALDRFLRHSASVSEMRLADDRRGNPTLVDDAARVMLAVLKQLDCQAPLWGTYHYGGHEATTQLVLAESILIEARTLCRLKAERIVAQPHAERASAENEPQYAVLACKKILHTFGVKQRAWRSGLHVLLERYYRHV